jgi:Fic family protein
MNYWEINFQPNVNPYDPEIIELRIAIEAEKRAALDVPLPPAIRKKINRLNILRQIHSTTAIEGNTLQEEEIDYTLEMAQKDPSQIFNREQREIINANAVLEFIKNDAPKNQNGEITEGLIKKLHTITTQACDYQDNVPGKYRKVSVHAGEYSAPVPERVPELMQDFVKLINNFRVDELRYPVIRAVIAHFYLVSIHPFRDGNGRTSRGLEAYLLFHGGYNVNSFYSLANFYYKNRFEYVQKLQDARFRYDGNLTEFVTFALKGYLSEMHLVRSEVSKFVKILAFRDIVAERKRLGEINERQYRMMMYLTHSSDEQKTALFTLKSIAHKDFSKREHPLSIKLYEQLTDRTLKRDIDGLLKQHLIVISPNHQIQANLKLMEDFY